MKNYFLILFQFQKTNDKAIHFAVNSKHLKPVNVLLVLVSKQAKWKFYTTTFYAWQLYRQVLLRAHTSYGNSVRLSVWGVTTRYRNKHRSDRDSGFSPYDSLESLVSNEVIWCRWVRRFPSNGGIKEGYPLRNRNFTNIGSSSTKTVADRHRLAAYHNKHCLWAVC